MIKETIKKIDVKIKQKYCDVCGTEMRRYTQRQCVICKDDLCENCVAKEEMNMYDYNDVYCQSCWDNGREERIKIKELEDKIEQYVDEWYEKCNNKKEKING